MEWLPRTPSCRRRIKSIISPPVVTLCPNRFQTREIIFLFTWRTRAHTAINHPPRRCTLIVASAVGFFAIWWPLSRAGTVRLVGFLISPSPSPPHPLIWGKIQKKLSQLLSVTPTSRTMKPVLLVVVAETSKWIGSGEKRTKKDKKKTNCRHQTLWKATLKAFSAQSRLGFSCAPRLSSTKGLGGKHWQVEVWIIHTDWDQVLFPKLFEDESQLKHLNRPFFPPPFFLVPAAEAASFYLAGLHGVAKKREKVFALVWLKLRCIQIIPARFQPIQIS